MHARVFAGQPMALRTRACLDAGLLEAFGYRPGFPVADFPADVLLRVRRAGLPPAALRLNAPLQAGAGINDLPSVNQPSGLPNSSRI